MNNNTQPRPFGQSSAANKPQNIGSRVNETKGSDTLNETSAFDRYDAMRRLAEMSLPVDTNTIMKNVDNVIADAMQAINHSLKQSSDYIDGERQKLMQQHPSLSQAYQQQDQGNDISEFDQSPQPTQPILGEEGKDGKGRDNGQGTPSSNLSSSNPLSTLNSQAAETMSNIAQGYESKLMATHQNKQQQVMNKQASLTQAAFDMQQQMMEKQQTYQQQLLGMDDPALNVLTAEAKPHSMSQPEAMNQQEPVDQHPPHGVSE